MKYWKLGVAACAVLALGGLLLIGFGPWRFGAATPSTEDLKAQLERAHDAIVATEALETAQANRLWDRLFADLPGDASVALNRALSRVLHIDRLVEKTANTALTAEEREAAARELPTADEEARQAVEAFYRVSQDEVMRLWLASRLDLQQAARLTAPEAEVLRREVFARLVEAIQSDMLEDPRSAILGGTLTRVIDELESPIEGIPPEILTSAAAASAALSAKHADNLFLALRAGQLNIAAESADAVGPIRRSLELASAIRPSLAASTKAVGLTPAELVDRILEAVAAGQWQPAANQMRLWFNVLNSTELVRTDRRRASPHPLDRLSFSFLRRLSALLTPQLPIIASNAPLKFQPDGSGVAGDATCAIPVDIDLDLRPEIAAVSPAGALTLWQRSAATQWEQVADLDLQMGARGLLAADLFMVDASESSRLQRTATQDAEGPPPERHTALPALLVYGEQGVRMVAVHDPDAASGERITQVTEETGLEDVAQVTAAIAGDLEGDGDLDLAFATADRGLRFFANRGNRTFFEVNVPDRATALSGLRTVADMAIVDFDRDLDLDILTVDPDSGRLGVLENLLHLQFRYRELDEVPPLPGANQLQVADLDGNVSWDVVVGGPEQIQTVFSHTADAGVWTVDHVDVAAGASSPFLLADLDNDSWQELITRDGGSLQVQRLGGPPAIHEIASELGMLGRCAAAVDLDLDGRLDIVSAADGQWSAYQNATAPTGHHLSVRLRGIDDNNANSGRVNHYAIGSVIELRFGPHYRAKVVTSPTTHFGLDGFDTASFLRVIFPNGLTQTIVDPAVDTLVEEQQTLKGSCPYLYTWDGEKLAFVTDCLWAAPLGLQVAAGVVAKDRPWEYLKVDGSHVQERDGYYDFRITEELWEVAYFDHVSLLAVDHPADVDVWTNEKVGPAEIAEPTIYAFPPSSRLPLKSGADTRGKDVTEDLRVIDRKYVQGFDRRIRQGLCPPHWVDLEFDQLPAEGTDDASLFLVLTGWILPTDTSLNIQIDQNPEMPAVEYPSLWVPDSTQPEGWRKAIPFMGFPGGKTKTIVVDVSEVANRNDPRFRIRTSAQIYWDAAQLAVQTSAPEIVTHELNLVAAESLYHGFSRQLDSSAAAPTVYDYADATEFPKWPPLRGAFTAYGDCRALLQQWDDAMVVMGSGDELRLRFSVPEQEVPEGWKRDFVLHCVGWDKDADLNTLTGQSSEPLPFREMTRYPPSQAEAERSEQVRRRNAQHLQRTLRFRDFWRR